MFNKHYLRLWFHLYISC